MSKVFTLLEEISMKGVIVGVQSHTQIREAVDSFSNETLTRILPMLTENSAKRLLKNADAVVYLTIGRDDVTDKIKRIAK